MARPSVDNYIEDYKNAKSVRQPHESDWRLAAAYCLPQHYGAWQTEGPALYQSNGQATLRRTVFDSTGARALRKYVAILERLATPTGVRWHVLTPTDKKLLKSYRVKAYFDELTDMLFDWRYGARANFRSASNETYAGIGAYGTGPLYVGKRQPNAMYAGPSLLYKACPLRDIFFLTNVNGEVNKVFRRYFMNVRMFREEFPNATMPRSVALEASRPVPDSNKYWEFFHCVQPRTDHDPGAADARRHPIVSSHVCVDDKEFIGNEGGFRSMPYLTPRSFTVAGDQYGYSPAVDVLSSLGGASTMKKAMLKQGNMAAEPVILAYDDGVINGVDLRPGAVNYGGVDRQGRPLIHTLQTGRYDINKDLVKEEQAAAEDAFFVTLFQILVETPEMTATEVLERVAEKAALLSPTMGRVQTEKLGPMIEREIDVLDEMGALPEMPPELREAAGQYKIGYTSPLAKSMYADEIAGFFRAVNFSMEISHATGDPSYLDHYDFDVAIPEIADKTAVPTRWMREPEALKGLRDQRQKQADVQQMVDAAPAAASVAKTMQAQPQRTGV